MSTKVVLSGDNLTLEDVVAVAKHCAEVEITDEAKAHLASARKLVFDLVDADFPIYGFNVGVGWNKDRKVLKEFFSQYNTNLIFSHSISVPPYASIEDTRAAMLARLATMLVGCTGVAPEIPLILAEMLNKKIHPRIPERGSVGEGDIGILSHLGLAIIGEGEVEYRGEIMSSKEAFAAAGIAPVVLGPKDGLAIVSSNAMAAGQAAMVLHEMMRLMDSTEVIYALSLEGFNGNTAPIDDKIQALRRYKGQRDVSARVRRYIEGSYIYDRDPEKMVHDPLCYRDFAHVHGAVRELMDYAKERLEIQFNTTEDNPCVLLEERTILPSANFEPLNWVLPFESLAIGLSHVSKMCCNRTMKLVNPQFTKLPRFLSPNVETLGFATVQKTFASLDAEIRHLCNPCSMDSFSLAGDMEDTGCNSPYVMQNLKRIVDDLTYIFALELIHATQAMEYRKEQGKKFAPKTEAVYKNFRETVSFYDKDRPITNDLIKAYKFIKCGELLETII